MRRTKEVRDRTNLASSPDVGDFEVEMVMALMKSEGDMGSIASGFVARHFDPSKGAAPKTSSSSSPSSIAASAVATPTSSSGFVEFSSSGHAINIGRATVTEVGFNVGSVVGLKATDGGSMVKQWQIAQINANGPVDLHNVNRDGSIDKSTIVSVSLSSFLDDGYHVMVQREVDGRTPAQENPELTIELNKPFIHIAMKTPLKKATT